MARSRVLVLSLWILTQAANAQSGRFAIFFKDKSGTPFTVDEPAQFLSQKSIDRRAKNNASISVEDLPVVSSYIFEVKNLGVEILSQSKWLNCAIVQVDGDELSQIMQLSFVTSSEYLGPLKSAGGGRVKKINQKKDSNLNIVNLVQSTMLGLNDMHNDNFFGEGILIGVFDSGFPGVNVASAFKSLFDEGRINFTVDLVGKSGNVFQYDDHGTEVLSIMAASQVGTYLGGAPKASYQLYVTEDAGSEFRIEEYNWLVAAEKADSAGVNIINSSLGYNLFDDASMDYKITQLDGKTAVVSIAAAKAAAKGILVVASAGNDGNTPWRLVNPPADADGVMAVGSIGTSGNLANFSSVGPTADGRMKPQVVALGSGVSVIKANGTTGVTSGTSASAPLVASLAAGLMQAFPHLNASEIYDLIVQSGDMSENPDNLKGYGVPHYLAAKKVVTGEEPPQPTSEIYLYPNPAGDQPLKIWMDIAPGQLAMVSIYDLQGKLVFRSDGVVTTVNNPVEFDVSGFSAGLYVVKVEAEGILKTIRLVKL